MNNGFGKKKNYIYGLAGTEITKLFTPLDI